MAKKVKEVEKGGVLGFILGILSIVFCWIPIVGVILGVLGLIFSIKQNKKSPNWMSISGLVLSIIGIVINVLLWIVSMIMWSALSSY